MEMTQCMCVRMVVWVDRDGALYVLRRMHSPHLCDALGKNKTPPQTAPVRCPAPAPPQPHVWGLHTEPGRPVHLLSSLLAEVCDQVSFSVQACGPLVKGRLWTHLGSGSACGGGGSWHLLGA